MKRHLFLFCVLATTTLSAQVQSPLTPDSPSVVPKLNKTQELAVINAVQQIEIARLKMVMAQQEMSVAQKMAQTLLETLQVEGYTLNLDKLVYEPIKKLPKGVDDKK